MQRFSFGKNWSEFLSVLNEERIAVAAQELSGKLGDLRGKSFLDIGCGSGIHSLAAVRLGAARVHSFDYDAESVACAQQVKTRYAPNADWLIEQGSALDKEYLLSLGKFDIVYSWGVLHHTGDMWKALDLARTPVAPGGKLMVAIYNDQGLQSQMWRAIKKSYVSVAPLRTPLALLTLALTWGPKFVLRGPRAIREWRQYAANRGMSPWHDVIDWAGGYPFEVAKPRDIVTFYQNAGLALSTSKLVGKKLGCNEFVFSISS